MLKKVGLLRRPVAGAIMLLIGAGSWGEALSAGQAADAPAAITDVKSVSADPGRNISAANAHQSFIRISDTEPTPVRKNLKIGLGKSVLIEFPRDVRDVMVSNPAAVDAVVLSTNRVFLLARKIGEANAFFFDTNGDQFATMEIYIERETAALESLLNRTIPGSSIKVEMLNQTVVLTGHVKNPTDAVRAANIARQFSTVEYEVNSTDAKEGASVRRFDKTEGESVINMLVVEAEEQVMLKVTVAEVQRSLMKQLGINLGGAINAGSFSTTLLTENALPLTAAAGLGTLPIFGQNTKIDNTTACGSGFGICGYNGGPSTTSFGNSGLTGGWQGNGGQINSALRMLERDGLIRTLAEPNLTAVSGEPAKFLAGGEYPVPVVDTLGALSVQYKEFGVGLAFTPIVLSEGRISLKIETEVSELTSVGAVTLSGISIPALKKRQAKSTVELPSGGTLALAGLISDETSQNIDGFPGAKDIPIIGALFRSRDFIKRETELVVIVTPYLVKPTSRQELATPADGLVASTDMRANFLGELNRIYGKSQAPPAGDLKGDYGFIVE
jgi:pilus assembly protein CpaC